MYYTIYKTTNVLNEKFYIGKHQTKNLDDGYLGSGKLLKRAIKKHGIENFKKEILHVFDTEEEMNAKEKELVVLSEASYNLCPGGHGGFGYINSLPTTKENRSNAGKLGKIALEEKKKNDFNYKLKVTKNHSDGLKRSHKNGNGHITEKFLKHFTGKTHSEEWKKKHSETMKTKIPWNKGKPRTPEEKEKIRQGVLKSRG